MSTYSSDYTWSTWTSTSASVSTSTTCSSDHTVWYRWNDSGTAATCTLSEDNNSYIWTEWVTAETLSNVTYVIDSTDATWNRLVELDEQNVPEYVQGSGSFELTEEQREEARRRQEEQQKRYEEQEKERAEAEKVAKELLMELIGEDQAKIYEETGRLLVHGKECDYIIPKNGFIKKVEKDKITDLCVHLRQKHLYPDTDNVVAMMLSLKANEEKVVKMANNHGSRPKTEEAMRELKAAVGF